MGGPGTAYQGPAPAEVSTGRPRWSRGQPGHGAEFARRLAGRGSNLVRV